jgi:hypothetical protein
MYEFKDINVTAARTISKNDDKMVLLDLLSDKYNTRIE